MLKFHVFWSICSNPNFSKMSIELLQNSAVIYVFSTLSVLQNSDRNSGYHFLTIEWLHISHIFISVCLSTVDRRSRERFIESNNQIASLVEKFKLEGGAYRKYVGPPPEMENVETHQKIPLTAYGRPGTFSVLLTLIR